jgi:hypothetical protein
MSQSREDDEPVEVKQEFAALVPLLGKAATLRRFLCVSLNSRSFS